MANFNFNKVMLGGRLTADPENRQTDTGISVTRFTVAVNRKQAKDKEQTTDFFNVTAWRATADFVAKFFSKGSSIFIVGTLQNRSWTDTDGNKRYATDIVADEVSFVDSKSESGQASTYIPDAYLGTEAKNSPDEGDDLPF